MFPHYFTLAVFGVTTHKVVQCRYNDLQHDGDCEAVPA